ncbi:tetratricopeptide repeat protein [Streptomyces sp. NPDC059909]|uniref:tetratricopeptide repeat protein n=1 Tax=Streptomyces sp. NPDC059909 TaxID=3346998 RepID=UPI003651FF2D
MHKRYALVVASQWDAPGRHLDELAAQAEQLRSWLLHPDRGRCAPAHGDGLLLDPGSVDEVRDAVAGAFAHAAASAASASSTGRARATLVLAFLGHGVGVRDQEFLFPVRDTPLSPDATTAYALPEGLRDGLARNTDVRALAVVVDTCESGVAALTGAREWIPVSMEQGREIGLITSSSSDQPSYGMAFVRGVNKVLADGDARLGESLYDDDVRWAAGLTVRGQQPQTLRHGGSYSDERGPVRQHWIAQNVAHLRPYSVLASTAPGKAQLQHLRWFQKPAHLTEVITAATGHRAVAVVGRKGHGKSLLTAALCRPELLPHTARLSVPALAHLTADSVDDSVLARIGRQLEQYLPGFADAVAAFHQEVAKPERDQMPPELRLVAEPLRRYSRADEAAPVRIAVDGLDQLEPSVLRRLADALCRLVEAAPDWFGIVVTARDGLDLPPEWHTVILPPATERELGGFLDAQAYDPEGRADLLRRAAGNWQIASLLVTYGAEAGDLPTEDELYEEALGRARKRAPDGREEWVDAVLTVLGAAGQGPVLPRSLLREGARLLGGPESDTALDEVLALLPGLLSRVRVSAGSDGHGRPEDFGYADDSGAPAVEVIGIDHQTLVEHIEHFEHGLSLAEGHHALAEALVGMAPMDQHRQGDPLHDYAREAEPVHLWETGAYDRLLDSLEQRGSGDAAANRDRWEAWCARLAQPGRPGPEHPTTLRARQRAAYWAGRAGSYRRSRAMYEDVLAVQSRVLGTDDEDLLESRHRIAYAAGQTGSFAEAVELHSALLADQLRVFGPDDRRTLETRHHIAYWTGRGGAMAEGLRLHEELLPHQTRVLGHKHKDVLESRHYIAYWYGRTGRQEEALVLHEELLRDRIGVFGEADEQVMFSRMNICKFTAEAGRLREALDAYHELLPVVEHHKSADHPDTLLVRLNIARFTWELGDREEALRLHVALLDDQRRVNGERHPTALITRHNLAWLHGELGDAARAASELAALFDERAEVYGSERHPEVLTTRLGVAWWTAEAGDPAAGAALLREVLDERVRVLGPDHPDVLDARSRLGELLGRVGGEHTAEAVTLLRATVAEQSERNGARHPGTLASRARLADALLRAGRREEARALLAELLPHQSAVLGPEHPYTVRTREELGAGG